MVKVDIADAAADLSCCLARVEQGETILLCRDNTPVAEIRPVARLPKQPRPVGIDRGMNVPPVFFEPLPDELLDAFTGGPSTND